MDHKDPTEALSPDLLADLESVAVVEQRSSSEILREAVQTYLRDRKGTSEMRSKLTPKEAATRMLELRKGNVRLDDEAIRDLMTYGRM